MVAKAPLATFLASTAPPAAPAVSPSPNAPASEEAPSATAHMEEAARAVILTILSYMSPISNSDLKAKSEIEPELYAKILADLTADGLIVEQADGYVLSEKGGDAAAKQRARILSPIS